MPGFWHKFTWFRAHATIVPVSFMLLKRKQGQSVATLGTGRFVSAQCGIGLFPRIPARDQFDNGSHPDGGGARLHGHG
jgi:hypothetical protein